MSDNLYMKNYMRVRRDRIKECKQIRREIDRDLIEYEVRKMDVNFFPLMAGYKSAERGESYDKRQTKDWKYGWKLWQRKQKGAP